VKKQQEETKPVAAPAAEKSSEPDVKKQQEETKPVAAPAAEKSSEPDVKKQQEETKPVTTTVTCEPATEAAPGGSHEETKASLKKERRFSAKSRIKRVCPPGWLDAAEAYCACLARGDEWPSTDAEKTLSENAGVDFENARDTFEGFDVDGDRHVQIDELAKAMEQLGNNDGGEITEEIQEMFSDADVNGDGVVDFLEFLGMMGEQEGEEEE